MIDTQNYKYNTSSIIELMLRPIDGAPKNSMGLLDRRLFTGENRIKLVMDSQTCLWTVKYDSGAVPEKLRGKYTKYQTLLDLAKDYFKKRNVEIVEIRDKQLAPTT